MIIKKKKKSNLEIHLVSLEVVFNIDLTGFKLAFENSVDS